MSFQLFFQYEFIRIALVCALLVGVIGGILSPIIVLKQRSYAADAVTHLIFPGVLAGYISSQVFHLPLFVCFLFGAMISGYIGNVLIEFFIKNLKVTSDSATIITLTGFLGIGILGLFKYRGTKIDIDNVFFGDLLGLSWNDAGLLMLVLLLLLLLLFFLKKHWDAWICDPEFGQLVGFQIKMLDRIFPIILTLVILVTIFVTGGLMVSALLTLPSILVRPRSIIYLPTILMSVFIVVSGLFFAFSFDLPLGASVVVLGLVFVFLKSFFSYLKIFQ